MTKQSVREQIQARAMRDKGEDQELTPVEIPGEKFEPESLEDMMKRIVRTQVSAHLEAARAGTQADEDLALLDVDKVPDPMLTPHTVADMEPGAPGYAPTMQELLETAVEMVANPPLSPAEPENPEGEPTPSEADGQEVSQLPATA